MRDLRRTYGIARAVIAVVIIIVIIIAAAGAFVLAGSNKSSTTKTQSTSSNSSITTSLSGSTSSLSSASSTSSSPASTSSGFSSSSTSLNSTSSASTASGNSSQLIIDEAANPISTDPGVTADNPGLELAQNAELPLIFFNYSDYSHFIPVLATSWNESSNGLNYTFYLHNDVYYSNNDSFNAYVVWYNIYRDIVMNQGAGFVFTLYFNASGITAGDLNSLNNAQNIPNSTLLSLMKNPNQSVQVVNQTDVIFHLEYAFPAFLETLGTSPWVFEDPYFVGQHGGVVANQPNSYMAVNATMVGDAPYVLQAWVQNQYAILVANPHYWAQSKQLGLYLQPAKVHEIVINYKTDELTRQLDLQSGKVQASIITYNDIPSTLKQSNNVYIPNTGLSGSLEYITIDTEKGPTNNTLVRRAIIEAINVTQIQQSVYNGYAAAFVGPMPKGIPDYNNSIQPIPYNVSDAKRLLTEAGYSNGQGLPQLNFVYPQSAYISLVAQILQSDLAQIGINLQPQQVSASIWNNYIYSTAGNSSSAPYLLYGSYTYIPDFAGYEYIVDSALQSENYIANQTINSLVSASNAQTNTTARAQEISQITLDVQQNAADIWLSTAIDLFDTAQGYGPIVWNHCVSGMWYNSGYNGLAFNALTYTCAP